jgi:hypothetical protein
MDQTDTYPIIFTVESSKFITWFGSNVEALKAIEMSEGFVLPAFPKKEFLAIS